MQAAGLASHGGTKPSLAPFECASTPAYIQNVCKLKRHLSGDVDVFPRKSYQGICKVRVILRPRVLQCEVSGLQKSGIFLYATNSLPRQKPQHMKKLGVKKVCLNAWTKHNEPINTYTKNSVGHTRPHIKRGIIRVWRELIFV